MFPSKSHTTSSWDPADDTVVRFEGVNIRRAVSRKLAYESKISVANTAIGFLFPIRVEKRTDLLLTTMMTITIKWKQKTNPREVICIVAR